MLFSHKDNCAGKYMSLWLAHKHSSFWFHIPSVHVKLKHDNFGFIQLMVWFKVESYPFCVIYNKAAIWLICSFVCTAIWGTRFSKFLSKIVDSDFLSDWFFFLTLLQIEKVFNNIKRFFIATRGIDPAYEFHLQFGYFSGDMLS